MKDIQTQLGRAPNSIVAVVNTLQELGQGTGQMKQQFLAYSNAVNEMHSHAALVRTLRRDLQQQQSAFTKDWAKRLDNIKDADLRQQSADRRDKALAVFKELHVEADVVKAKFDPWLEAVTDLRNYLENDLNPSGVRSVADRIKKVSANAKEITAELATVNKNLAEVIDASSATKAKH